MRFLLTVRPAAYLILLFALALSPLAQTPERGVIEGRVIDAETGEPLPGASVRLRELGRGQATLPDGTFSFDRLPGRSLTVAAQFVGYLPAEQRVRVEPGEAVRVDFALEPTPIEMAGVVVTGMGRERGIADTYRPTAVVDGRELERNLSSSIAQTLQRLPGLHAVYNGPAATRPTIRGMGGDRILVLEDGQRTGDLSTTAPDHAVASDPISAERIEVVRGPAGLLYGSNALGGVINVVREEVPRSQPQSLTGTVTSTLESVNRGAAGHVFVAAPLGPLSIRAEAFARGAGDTRTALGTLPSTDLTTYSARLGVSVTPEWGFAGLAYRYFDSAYGVPGEFNGEQIPGAHTGGVDIESRRHVLRAQAAHLEGLWWFDAIEADGNFTWYLLDEIEGINPVTGDPWIGASFDQISGSLNLVGRHSHDLDAFSTEGAIGAAFLARDLAASGGFTGTRSATEYSAAAFLYEEFARGPFRLQTGLRLDYRHVAPRSTRPITVGDREIQVRARSFTDVSGSVALLYDLHPGWTAGLSLARAFRSPAIEELFSDGPHLADFSYDIGNPELNSEIGHGADLFLRATRSRYSLEVGGFVNFISNYIYYRPTGELDDRFRRFPVFQATAEDALFFGFEARGQIAPLPGLVLDGRASYVRATLRPHGDPLPAIPPLTGGIEARYETGGWTGTLGWDAAAAQNRVPGRIESPVEPGETVELERATPGYGLLNASVGYRFDFGGTLHSVTLKGQNLTDAVWRDHLSRIKDIAPQPGRNLQLVYRLQF